MVTPIIARWAQRWAVVDRPEPRKQHRAPVSLLGGAAVLVSLAICGGTATWLARDEFLAGWTSDSAFGFLAGCCVGALVLAVVGLWDDVRPVPVRNKLVAELVAAGMLLTLFRPQTGMTWFGTAGLISVAWLLLVTNSFNLIDNMDGSAPGVGAVAAGFFALLAGDGIVSLVCAALAGTLVGFLVFNRHPARVFLGDGGSLPIGFLLGAFGLWVAAGGDRFVLIAPLIVGVPLLDTSLVVVSRLRRGVNPLTTPGKDHLSHRLVALGLPIPVAVAVLWALGLCCGLAGLAVSSLPKIATWVLVVSALALSAGVIVAMERVAPNRPTSSGNIGSGKAGDTS